MCARRFEPERINPVGVMEEEPGASATARRPGILSRLYNAPWEGRETALSSRSLPPGLGVQALTVMIPGLAYFLALVLKPSIVQAQMG
jgi:hypothetical protein